MNEERVIKILHWLGNIGSQHSVKTQTPKHSQRKKQHKIEIQKSIHNVIVPRFDAIEFRATRKHVIEYNVQRRNHKFVVMKGIDENWRHQTQQTTHDAPFEQVPKRTIIEDIKSQGETYE